MTQTASKEINKIDQLFHIRLTEIRLLHRFHFRKVQDRSYIWLCFVFLTSISQSWDQTWEHVGPQPQALQQTIHFETYFNPAVLVRVTTAVKRHHDRKQLWEEQVYFIHSSTQQFIIRQWWQELKEGRSLEAGADAEVTEGAAYWLANHCLFSLLPHRTQDST